jgi:predicted N-formylglutamate amidohydrolase
MTLLLTCEHAGNRVPAAYRELFAAHGDLLNSHRGWDPGAAPLARAMASALHAPLIEHEWTRLLIETNRSPRHPALFSSVTRPLPRDERRRIVERYYEPHRARVVETIESSLCRGMVVHIGVHTFTPVLNDVTRNADIGLLYDPRREAERAFCARWRRAILTRDPSLRVRMNYPYLGRADGLITFLRKRFAADRYLGVELEVNQGLLDAAGRPFPAQLTRTLTASLADTFRPPPLKPGHSDAPDR